MGFGFHYVGLSKLTVVLGVCFSGSYCSGVHTLFWAYFTYWVTECLKHVSAKILLLLFIRETSFVHLQLKRTVKPSGGERMGVSLL